MSDINIAVMASSNGIKYKVGDTFKTFDEVQAIINDKVQNASSPFTDIPILHDCLDAVYHAELLHDPSAKSALKEAELSLISPIDKKMIALSDNSLRYFVSVGDKPFWGYCTDDSYINLKPDVNAYGFYIDNKEPLSDKSKLMLLKSDFYANACGVYDTPDGKSDKEFLDNRFSRSDFDKYRALRGNIKDIMSALEQLERPKIKIKLDPTKVAQPDKNVKPIRFNLSLSDKDNKPRNNGDER